jgi:phosphoglycolate phosphatase
MLHKKLLCDIIILIYYGLVYYERKHTEMNKIKLLIFDLDGTLADTLEAITNGLNLTLKNYGFPTHSCEETTKMIGNGAKNLVRSACPKGTFEGENGDALFAEIYKNYCDMYGKTYLDTKVCYAGIPEALENFKKAGYVLAVLSNKQDTFVKGIVKQILPEGIISLAQGQTELPIKPDPTVPLMIAEKFGVTPAECAFIGDSDVDIRTGQNAGMFSACVTWGYRPRADLLKLGADAYADTPEELEKIFVKE